jgi:hypothetical protein
MRISPDRNQCDREAQTRPTSHPVDFQFEEFWSDQLNRLKNYVESQAMKSESRGDQRPTRPESQKQQLA